MRKRSSALSLALCVALLAGCAKTTLVGIAPQNSDTYRFTKTIYVVLKTGETCEIRGFTVTSDSISGTRVLRNAGGKIIEQRAAEIELKEIITIQVVKSSNRTWLFFGTGCGLGLGVAALTVAGALVLLYIIAAAGS